MCGIAGFVGETMIDDGAIDSCLYEMRRRGPDARDVFTGRTRDGRNVYLLHTRLSIIDLDPRANQPFHWGDKVLVTNGELYNYVEVREELRSHGETFITESDTEVMIHALANDGVAALDRFEGMWAFAFWDADSDELLLSRDRFGEKPLYVLPTEGGLYFGSEPKFIAALLGRSLEIDLNHLQRYLVNGYKSLYKSPSTFFAELEEVPPGGFLALDGNGVKKGSYWEPRHAPDGDMTMEDAVAGARERLIASVGLRLRADVPLAFCMSGGVDSNALISIARRVFGHDVHGFTIMNTDERYEEQDLVEAAVRELGIRHTSIPVQPGDFLEDLRTLVRQHDAPVYTITYYAHWLLMRSIADHGYRISISGTAADELFTGYFDHHLMYLAAVADGKCHDESLRNWEAHIKPLVRNPFLQDSDLFVREPSFRDHIFLNSEVFSGYLYSGWSEPFSETAFTSSTLRNRMLNEMFHEAVPVILHEDDRNAMYFSIENRSPFLDRDLFEFCNRIPTPLLIRDGYGKYVLRRAMEGIAPRAVLENHRKVGFNAPVLDFLQVSNPATRADLLAESPIFELVRREAIEALIGRDYLPNSESKFLFSFINAKLFLEEFS